MAEIRTATTLRHKEAEIVRAIENYEKALAQARTDLAHVRAVAELFDRANVTAPAAAYSNLRLIFNRSDLAAVCVAALTEKSPQSTRDLARLCLKAKGLEAQDKVMEDTMMLKVVQLMRRLTRAGKAVEASRMHKPRMILWALPEP